MNYPPGKEPPPPMSPPPPAGPPPVYAPPPPPPRKSGAMKWVLIGCGVIGGLAVVCCGGFGLLTYFGVKKAIEETVARVKPIIEGNEEVKAQIGAVKDISVRWDSVKSEKADGRDVVSGTLDVVGERGKGQVHVELKEGEDKETAYVTLTFKDEQGKATPLGTWKSARDGTWKKEE